MLRKWGDGDESVLPDLVESLYGQLKELAHARLRRERAGHTLNTTGLVHEVYLRLVSAEHVDVRDRSHFLGLSSRMMRRILVDHARGRRAAKRGGSAEKITLIEELIPAEAVDPLLELDDALERFSVSFPRAAKALELYYFGGLTLEEVGEVLGISAATAMRDLRFAEAWLNREWNGSFDVLRAPMAAHQAGAPAGRRA